MVKSIGKFWITYHAGPAKACVNPVTGHFIHYRIGMFIFRPLLKIGKLVIGYRIS